MGKIKFTYGVEFAIGPVQRVCQPIKFEDADVMNTNQ